MNDKSKYYTIKELTKVMKCSEDAIMKCYYNRGLPLEKKNDEYIIKIECFNDWIKERTEIKETNNLIIVSIILFIFILIIFWFFVLE